MLIVALLSLPFLYIVLRRPVLRRLALRNAARRPRETVLVILGALLGTAIMTGSFVVGDTFTSSIRRGAYEQLGPVDEIVTGAGLAQGAAIRERLAGFRDREVDGTLPLTTANASAATVATPRRAAPDARLVETDFAAARTFGGDAHATGMSGTTPAPGEAAIGTDLARELRVGVGDRIEVFAYGASRTLQVSQVLPRRGVAGFWRGDEHTSDNAFVAPGTIAALLARGNHALGAPPEAMVLVSNRGGVVAGADATEAVTGTLAAHLGSLKYTLNAAKVSVLERADRNGSQLAQIFSSLGTFGVLAGILLLVNIFFMLADERKSELGMLRAVGLRRASLVGAFATEGWCYALASAVAGTFAGLGLGRAMMAFAARLRVGGSDAGRLPLHFAFTWASVERGLVLGFVIALVTVMLTSVWLSRFNIIRAIRDITESPPHRPHTRSYFFGGALAAFGGLLVALGALGVSFFGLVVGPVFIFVGIGPALARHLKRAHAATLISIAVLFWGVVAVPIALALQSSVSVFQFVAEGLMLVGAAVVLVTQQQHAIGHAVGRVANRSLHVRLGLAYPLARRFRTAMTLGMFALVVFILVYVSVIGAMFAGQLDQFTREASGGFDVIVSSNPSDPVALDRVARLPGVRAVAPLDALDLLVTRAPGLTQPREWSGSGYDQSFLRSGPPTLDDRGSYPNDRAAYVAVLADPHLAIVDKDFLGGGAGPPSQHIKIGDDFTVRDLGGGGARTFEVAAFSDNDFANNGVLMSRTAARAAFGDRGAPSRAYVDVADPDRFATGFEAQFLDHGGRADTIRSIVHDELASEQQFFVLIRGYLALGLIVGIAGIGVIMVRAVRERRRQVGVLRALGVQAAAVRRAFVVESAFVAAEGLVIGTVLALVTAWSITLTDAFGAGLGFRVPAFAIAGVVIGTLVCALLATAAPARAAARIRPAGRAPHDRLMPGGGRSRMNDRAFDDLVAEAEAAPIVGWDFSWLDGRATEARPSWGYSRLVAARLAGVGALLDIQTGGGEMLASIGPLPPTTVATEPWRLNLPIAANRLRGLGARVVAADGPDLPFRSDRFDLVICRHPTATPWPAIARVLRPGGTFLSQQIGGDNVEELGEVIRGPRPPGPTRGPARERTAAEANGLDVVDVREEALRCVFDDIGAVVYFLRLVVWIVPGFTVERYRAELRALHDRIRAEGPFVATSHRFLIEARKPE